ncbi:MAG: HAMP domain-containing sensor histidine kinase [Pseudomonadota bacterium]
MRPLPKFAGLTVLISMAGFVALGFLSIRRDVDNLRVISQDNILWSATQMEVELLRFQLSVAKLGVDQSEEALETVRNRFDILWSRVFMLGRGRVGVLMREYDEGHGSLDRISAYLEEIDPVVMELGATDSQTISALLSAFDALQRELRLYTLRVVRADTAASASVRDRIQVSSQATGAISLAAVLLSVFALVLILRENRRQRDLVDMSRKVADTAALSSRAKSRFLTMMSHELRNPLNGIMGPLALLSQSNLSGSQKRLVDQAKTCGQSMTQMLSGLLDYGEMQDGRFRLKTGAFTVSGLASSVSADLSTEPGTKPALKIAPGTPLRICGDVERMRQIIVHLCEYLLEAIGQDKIAIIFGYKDGMLEVAIELDSSIPAVAWKLDLLMGLGDVAPDQVSADALRPLIARGLISASRGRLTLQPSGGGAMSVVISVPCEIIADDRLRVRLETRSRAVATIYEAALRSESVQFLPQNDPTPADIVLVDVNCPAEDLAMSRLRSSNPHAIFVSLGRPKAPSTFDEVVENPSDMTGLKMRILDRIAS